MGSPPMNLLAATIATIALPPPISAMRLSDRPRDVLLGLRLECLSLATAGNPAAASLELDVELVEPTGPDVFVALRMAGHEVMARLPTGSAVRPGQKARFVVDLEKANLFDAASGVAL